MEKFINPILLYPNLHLLVVTSFDWASVISKHPSEYISIHHNTADLIAILMWTPRAMRLRSICKCPIPYSAVYC